ncbi:iron-sulfur cluster assembly protein [Methylosinus sp. Sm6]|uniref:iron-sulfur cluster assembly protein n=1 Tax=Methylosinus sp. Sm6 TaxID=2866948 RepID=UPI001C995035|nr:iron-sulfur cluster assembly protein [Methylosinus sp. Sm6]
MVGDAGLSAEAPLPHGRTKEQVEQLTQNIIAALKTVQDPEIPADIFELGLVYQIDISPEDVVHIEMTLTAPGCPVAGQIVEQVQSSVSLVPGVLAVVVKLVFDPPWDQSRMSDEARMTLDMW